MYADDTVLLAETKEKLQKIVDEFDRVCRRRKLKVSAGKSKVMVFERAREQTIDFAKPYRVVSEAMTGCIQYKGIQYKGSTDSNSPVGPNEAACALHTTTTL